MKNRNKISRRRSVHWQQLATIGVFLVLIAGMWFAGFQIFGSPGRAGDGSSVKGEEQAGDTTSAGSLFSDARNYPVAIMIDNLPEARAYQSGLSAAAVVYETLAEGGSTRYLAVFAGAPKVERIGPVRSARPYFARLAAGWGAFFWHAGGSPEGLAAVKSLVREKQMVNLNEISGLGPIYLWRDRSLAAPHNLFTNGEKIGKALLDFELNTLPPDKLTWRWEKDDNDKDAKEQAKKAAGKATSIFINFSPGKIFNPDYFYDAGGKNYERQLAGRPHLDYNNQAQLAPANLIIQKVPGERLLPSGYDRIDFDITGEGEAIFFRDGLVFVGKWKKASPGSQAEWLLDGKPFILKRGQVWVEIVPGKREIIYN